MDPNDGEASAEPKRERWEYDYIQWEDYGPTHHKFEKLTLNERGAQGWEAYNAGPVTWLKRRLA